MIRSRLNCDVHRSVPPIPTPTTTRRLCGATCASRRRRTARHRHSASLDRALRHDPAGQPDLERQSADDHGDLHRAPDFTGKTVLPVTTHAMSGLGNAPDDYAESCRGARIGTGLAVRGEPMRIVARGRGRLAASNRPLGRRRCARPVRDGNGPSLRPPPPTHASSRAARTRPRPHRTRSASRRARPRACGTPPATRSAAAAAPAAQRHAHDAEHEALRRRAQQRREQLSRSRAGTATAARSRRRRRTARR